MVDLSQLPAVSGRQFVPPDSAPQRQQQMQQQQPQQQLEKGSHSFPGQIELRAVSGSVVADLAATDPAAAAAAGAVGPVASPPAVGLASRAETWNSPLASRVATQSEAGGHQGSSTAVDWLPDIFPVPPRSPGPEHLVIGMDGSSSSSRGGPRAVEPAAGAAGDGSPAEGQQEPLRSIRVVRPQQTWVKPLLMGIIILALVTLIVVCPVVLSRSGGWVMRGGGGGLTLDGRAHCPSGSGCSC